MPTVPTRVSSYRRTPPTRAFSHVTGEPRPLLRGWLHAGAALLWIPAGAWLVTVSDPQYRAAVLTYVLCVFATVTVSAAYHIAARTPRSQRVWQRTDHAMVFVLVVGSYLPVCAAVLPPTTAILLGGTVTGVAIIGASLRGAGRARKFAASLYVVTGWLAVLVLPQLWAVSEPATVLLTIGGISYTAGALMFAARWPGRTAAVFGYHELFHACTLIGITCHYLAILSLTS